MLNIRVAPLESVVAFNEEEKRLIGNDYVDILGMFSDPGGKVPVMTPDGRFITYDTNHLTSAGAKYLGTMLFDRYRFLVGD